MASNDLLRWHRYYCWIDPCKHRTTKSEKIERYYYIDIEKALAWLEHDEDAIIGVEADRHLREHFGRDIKLDLRSSAKEYEFFHFPCNQILNSDAWEEGLNAFDPGKFPRYMQFRKAVLGEFRHYEIPVIELTKDNRKEAVCLVFEKVNTGGVPLSASSCSLPPMPLMVSRASICVRNGMEAGLLQGQPSKGFVNVWEDRDSFSKSRRPIFSKDSPCFTRMSVTVRTWPLENQQNRQ